MLFQTPPINQAFQIILSVTEKKEEPKEPTLDEKIASNYYTCTNLQWIRADNATCLDKPIAIVETPVTSPQNNSQLTVFTSSASQGAVSGNSYFAGQCVWYIKNIVPWVENGWGNGNDWVYKSGHRISATPAVGTVAAAISYNHVALVTAVSENTVTVSEMNYKGPYIISTRTAPIAEFQYIYP